MRSIEIESDIINRHRFIQLITSISLLLSLTTGVNAASNSEKNYLRISSSKSSDKSDLKIISIGGLLLKDSNMGFVAFDYIESPTNGESLSLDLGAGYVFNWDLSLYISLGVSLGYNLDSEDFNLAYYPEAGVVVDITQNFGISMSTKRYHSLYNENDPIVMMSLVFKN